MKQTTSESCSLQQVLSSRFSSVQKFSFSFIIILLFCANPSFSQTGYIYAHLKMINEESSPDFPFVLKNSSGTVISSFSLNDQATYDNVPLSGNVFSVYDMGVSHGAGGGDGQLWAIAGTTPGTGLSGTVYYRNPGSSNWISTGITNAQRIDGAYANQFVYIDGSGNVVFYNNGVTTTINTFGNALDVTANAGVIALSNTTIGAVWIYSNTYTATSAPVAGGTWTYMGNTGHQNKIDMNASGTSIAIINTNSNSVSTMSTTSPYTVTSLGSFGSGAATYPDVAYGDNGNVYAIANDNTSFNYIVYSYKGSAWNAEIETRNCTVVTAGASNLAYTTMYEAGLGTGRPGEIFSRQIDNTGTAHWIDDERVKNSSSLNGNGIFIPVTPGTYTLTETVPTGYDLGRYNIYDPGGSTTGNVNNNTVTFVVTAGEIVFAEYVNEKLVPKSIPLACGTPVNLETFDASNSSPIYTDTYGTGTYGTPAVQGTAFHYWAAPGAFDGYYSVVQNTTNWYTNTGLTDHTGNGGYFMLIDASFALDEFYRQRLTNLVVGGSYSISFYAANVTPAAVNLEPNVNFGLQDTLGAITWDTTGSITSTSWVNYKYNFTATSSTMDVFLRNANNGGNGNDLAIDDISIVLLAAPSPVATATNDCSANGTITITSPINAMYQYSDNGSAYQTSPTFSSVSPGTYNITTTFVGSTGCASAATIVTINPLACGNVYDDANGLTDNIINGTGTNASNAVYANLVNPTTNQVVSSVLVNTDGTYSLTGTLSTAYNIVLTNSLQAVGATLAASTLPSGWVSTGEGTTAAGDGTVNGITPISFGTSSNVAGANFGIDQLPTSNNRTFSNFNIAYLTGAQSNGNPTITGYEGVAANSTGFSSYYSTLGDMTGSDPEDCSTASSCNSSSSFYIATIGANTKLYYNGSAVARAQLSQILIRHCFQFMGKMDIAT